jgi:hypothetical protein
MNEAGWSFLTVRRAYPAARGGTVRAGGSLSERWSTFGQFLGLTLRRRRMARCQRRFGHRWQALRLQDERTAAEGVGDETVHCIELLNEKQLPKVNLFGYGQVERRYCSGEFTRCWASRTT